MSLHISQIGPAITSRMCLRALSNHSVVDGQKDCIDAQRLVRAIGGAMFVSRLNDCKAMLRLEPHHASWVFWGIYVTHSISRCNQRLGGRGSSWLWRRKFRRRRWIGDNARANSSTNLGTDPNAVGNAY